ncbi:low affinity immunoglobulin gamma Fc region receptor II-like isoform X1 [Astatotilapia calliptera]|uniref:Ig-like domain-containing protein n=1 Tax=Astatotilapia calliptera TaxID=8154 RepID=A0A3P8Q0B7_ASTCA|nr:low affinity immunoglobulin gamma Fc region receptor II-like isoform X1 [Astatotilapia calliptera]
MHQSIKVETFLTSTETFSPFSVLNIRMGHALFCASGLVLLNTLLSCGQTEDKPKPDLSVSSSWLSPGASVTLHCSVRSHSAEWRFYWYQAFFKNSSKAYYFELLPGGKNGTAQNSYIVHGQKQTAGYACRAGRQQPEHFTSDSKPVFVWSADSSSATATVKVTPDRVQHFSEESVSLRCEGKPSEWRVMRLSEAGYLANCSVWGTMSGSTCTIKNATTKPAVYWCESKLGGFSNAVNNTVQKSNIILVSPVHPVTEGEAVTLHCKLRNKTLKSSVLFFRNDNLISNDTRGRLNIPAVSKSDEGFYKCQYSEKQSPQSWMSVKAVSRPLKSSFTAQMIIGFVCGILLIAILLVIYLKVKGTQCKQTHVDSAVSEVSQNACQLEALYSEVHDDNLLYALVMHKNKGETQNNAGRPSQAAADGAIYSEVRLQENSSCS